MVAYCRGQGIANLYSLRNKRKIKAKISNLITTLGTKIMQELALIPSKQRSKVRTWNKSRSQWEKLSSPPMKRTFLLGWKPSSAVWMSITTIIQRTVVQVSLPPFPPDWYKPASIPCWPLKTIDMIIHYFQMSPKLLFWSQVFRGCWNDAGNNFKADQWCTSWWHQFMVLLQRGLRERRYEAFNRLRIFQVISVAVLGGLLWWHTPTSHIEDRVRIPSTCTIILLLF